MVSKQKLERLAQVARKRNALKRIEPLTIQIIDYESGTVLETYQAKTNPKTYDYFESIKRLAPGEL